MATCVWPNPIYPELECNCGSVGIALGGKYPGPVCIEHRIDAINSGSIITIPDNN